MLDMTRKKQASTAIAPAKKGKPIKGLILTGIVIAMAVCVYAGFEAQFFERAYYEIQNLTTQEVKVGTGVYTGETDFGIFTGNGTFTFTSGEFYEGAWQNFQMEGMGKLSHPGSGTYSGEFVNAQKSGQGTFIWDNGDTYEGHWDNDAMNGEGIYRFADGGTMDGEFQDNCFDHGTYTFINLTGNYVIQYADKEMATASIQFADGSIYEGDFSDGQINGHGTITYPNGDTYTGEYENGKRCGTGIYDWNFGDQYNGDWNADKMDGEGTYTFSSGVRLTGEFSDNQFHSGEYKTNSEAGTYTFTLKNGQAVAVELSLQSGLNYKGGFSDGAFHGQGELTYVTGESYEGDFVGGLRSGKGTYRWTDGAYYDGQWSEDQMNGEGTYYYPNGSDGYKLVGSFVDGKPDGECKYYVTSSRSYGTTWNNGKCIKVTE